MKFTYKLQFIFIFCTIFLYNIVSANNTIIYDIGEHIVSVPDTNKLSKKRPNNQFQPQPNVNSESKIESKSKTDSNSKVESKHKVQNQPNIVPDSTINKRPKIESKEKVVYISASVNCKNCPEEMKKQLAYVKGIKDVRVNTKKELLIIIYDSTKTNEQIILKEVLKHNMGGEIVNPQKSPNN